MFDIWLNLCIFFLNLFPLQLPVFNFTIKFKNLFSVKILTFRFDLFISFVYFYCLFFKRFTLSDCFLLDSAFLLGKDVVHLNGCHLEVLPSFEHVCCIERTSCNWSYILVFLLYFLYFLHYLFLILLYFVEILNSHSHFLHIFRLWLYLRHNCSDVLLDLLALKFDWVFNKLNKSFYELA